MPTPGMATASDAGLLKFMVKQSLKAWTREYRRIGGGAFAMPLCQEAIYDATERNVVVKKAAQVAISEWMINEALWTCDTGRANRGNALYVFPKLEQGLDFSRARIGEAVKQSPYLRGRRELPDNIKLRKIGMGYLYVRGAQTRDQMISADIDTVLCDEAAQYDMGTVETLNKRLGSSQDPRIRVGSTPRYPSDEAGELWEQSTQEEYEVKCSHCATWQVLAIENLDPLSAKVRCGNCDGDMGQDRLGAGRWVAKQPGKEWRGFHVSKLISPRSDITDLAQTYAKFLEGLLSATKIGEFFNSDLGESYLPEGSYLDPASIDDCIDRSYDMPQKADDDEATYVMGVDVGKRLHTVIAKMEGSFLRVVYVGAEAHFEDLDPLIARYNVRRLVVDANPETRKAQELADDYRDGKVFLAYYPNFTEGNEVGLAVWQPDKKVVNIRRTAALDALQALVHTQRLVLPRLGRDLGGHFDKKKGVGEFYAHLGSPIRVVEDTDKGQPVAHYDNNGPDHYAHACVYMLIAAQGAMQSGQFSVSTATVDFSKTIETLADKALAALRRLHGFVDPSEEKEEDDKDDESGIGDEDGDEVAIFTAGEAGVVDAVDYNDPRRLFVRLLGGR